VLYAFQEGHPGTELHAGGGLITLGQYQHLIDLCRRHLLPGWALLDWGCGHGHFSYVLLKAGYRVHAYSLEDESPFLRRLRTCYPDRFVFVQGRREEPVRLPFPEETFDAVFSVGVLEHVRETRGTETESLREIRRILRPGGLFLAYHLPNRYSLIEMLARLLGHPRSHRYKFSVNDIADLCRASGFTLRERRSYGMIPRNSWAKAPLRIRLSHAAFRIIGGLDEFLESVVPLICQNHLFVAQARP